MISIRLRPLVFVGTAALLVGACGDSGTGRVNLQLSTRSGVRMAAAAVRPQLSLTGVGQATVTLGGDQIVIDQVELSGAISATRRIVNAASAPMRFKIASRMLASTR